MTAVATMATAASSVSVALASITVAAVAVSWASTSVTIPVAVTGLRRTVLESLVVCLYLLKQLFAELFCLCYTFGARSTELC
jgi:hypothetical protein